VLNQIEELYNLYSEEEGPPKIVKVYNDGLEFNLDIENRPADPYLKL